MKCNSKNVCVKAERTQELLLDCTYFYRNKIARHHILEDIFLFVILYGTSDYQKYLF